MHLRKVTVEAGIAQAGTGYERHAGGVFNFGNLGEISIRQQTRVTRQGLKEQTRCYTRATTPVLTRGRHVLAQKGTAVFKGKQMPSTWRTRAAIEAAIAAGVVVGRFVAYSATVFVYGLYGLILASVVGGVGCALLCVLATDRFVAVGLGYATSVALTFVLSNHWEGCATAVCGFTIIFVSAGSPALLVSLFCAYLKWAELWD
jgi:hypothetical protein